MRHIVGGNRFTLVEMLVVIAIIAILVALLLPSLASAVATARSTACQSNIRQLMIGMISYADSNRNFFPPNSQYAPAHQPWYTNYLLGPYVGNQGYELAHCAKDDWIGISATNNFSPNYVSYTTTPPTVTGPWTPITRARNAIKTVVFADAKVNWFNSSTMNCTANASGSIINRHNYRANLGFLDGHIRASADTNAEKLAGLIDNDIKTK